MIFRFVPMLEVSTGDFRSWLNVSGDSTSMAGGVIAIGAMVGEYGPKTASILSGTW